MSNAGYIIISPQRNAPTSPLIQQDAHQTKACVHSPRVSMQPSLARARACRTLLPTPERVKVLALPLPVHVACRQYYNIGSHML